MTRSYLDRVGVDRSDLLTGLLAGLAAVIGSAARTGVTSQFVAEPIARWLAQWVPGVVLTVTILVLGDLGQRLHLASAIVLAAAVLGGATLVGLVVGRRAGVRWDGAPLVVPLVWVPTWLLTGAVAAGLAAGVAAGIIVAAAAYAGASDGTRGVSLARRRALGGLVGLAAVGLIRTLLGGRAADPPATTGARAGDDDAVPALAGDERATIDSMLRSAAQESLAVDGIEPLVSEDFYVVDITVIPPSLSADHWQLGFVGAIDEPYTLTYDRLTSLPADHRYITLRCVGERLNGHKMDTAVWTGVPMARFIDRVDPEGACDCVMLRAADNYFERFPVDALRRGFLAYGMNGNPLPRQHGYPVRALIPGHWGEINVKWVTEFEFLEEEAEGYWERRGWHGTGPVKTVAKLHAVNPLADGRMQVGGHAYAGTRGVSGVEVRVDDRGWQDAVLSEPLPGDDVWRQWQFDYRPPDERHRVTVRAVEADGTIQPKEESDPFPSGPSGWVTRTVDP